MIDGVCSYMEGKACGWGTGSSRRTSGPPSSGLARSRGDYKAPWAGTAVSHQTENGGILELGRDASRIPDRRWPSLLEVLHHGSE